MTLLRRAATQPQIRIAGDLWLSTIAPWGDLVITQGRHGSYEVTFSLAMKSRAWRHPALRSRRRVEVFLGGQPFWGGRTNDANWDEGTFSAEGYHREAEGAACLNAAGRPTTSPNTAIDQAIDRGVVSWRRIDDWGDPAMMGGDGDAGTDDPEPVMLDALLDARTAEYGITGTEWRVDPQRRLVQYTPDNGIEWVVPPGVVSMGTATDERIDRVLISYRDSGDSDYRRMASYPANSPVGGIEAVTSVDKKVSITAGKAADYAETIYMRTNRGQDGWTNGITLGPGQLLTPGGQYAHPSQPTGGDTVRLLGIPDPRDGVLDDLRFTIDTAAWNVSDRTLQLNPVGLVDRSFESIARHVLPRPKKNRSTWAHAEASGL